MRGTIAGLASPAPLTETLPSMLRTDHFAQQLCASFDEVLAPVILSLDALPAYLDLSTTPEDMLPWLAQWLGMSVDPSQDMEIQRSLLRSASELHATRGRGDVGGVGHRREATSRARLTPLARPRTVSTPNGDHSIAPC